MGQCKYCGEDAGLFSHVHSFKGHPVEHSYMDNAGTGTLYITNKHIIFHSSERSAKIPYKKIIGLNPYQDGMGVQQDGAKVSGYAFLTAICSLLFCLAKLFCQVLLRHPFCFKDFIDSISNGNRHFHL